MEQTLLTNIACILLSGAAVIALLKLFDARDARHARESWDKYFEAQDREIWITDDGSILNGEMDAEFSRWPKRK